ncbi:MAG: diaminopimelate decarboxylase, partial [Candidatus Omnitrophica bacterium]|nr:diaminopimelate decarboxylase [Candidatus Omnitrophota bacterium]
MHEFEFRGEQLYCEDVSVQDLVEKFGTPLYVYSYNTFIGHFLKLKKAFAPVKPLICYSVKANSNLAILKALVEHGSGLDIVSGGELYRALKVGCPPSRIVYASVGKTDKEIEEAITKGILFFNVESLPELENINRIARKLKKKTNVALRINPDVEAKTHKYITTGKLTNKF